MFSPTDLRNISWKGWAAEMLKLIRFEFRKLIRSGSFYICTAILVLLSALTVYTTKYANEQLGMITPDSSALTSLMRALPTSTISILLGIFIALYVCEDFAGGTIRNILTRGYSRFGVYVSKFAVVIVSTVVMSAICCAASYAIGIYVWGSADASVGSEQIKTLLYQLALMIAFASVFYTMCSIVQKTGGSIACCVVFPMVITILLKLADSALSEQEIVLSQYWIENLNQSIALIHAESEDLHKALAGAGIYTAASLAIGWLATMKREY